MVTKMFEVTQDNFQQEVLASSQPVLVDFTADWCSPCKMIAPFVDQIAEEYQGKIRVVRLDADAYPDLTAVYGVMGLPTLILFKNGEPVERIIGYQPKAKLSAKIAAHIV